MIVEMVWIDKYIDSIIKYGNRVAGVLASKTITTLEDLFMDSLAFQSANEYFRRLIRYVRK